MKRHSAILQNACWVLLLLLGIAGILYGVYREEAELVLSKAINICFQCIGLG